MRQFRVGNACLISKTKYGGILFFFQTASTGKALALLHCRTLHHWYILPPCVLVSADLLPPHFPIGQSFPLGLAFFFIVQSYKNYMFSPSKQRKTILKRLVFICFFVTFLFHWFLHNIAMSTLPPCVALSRFLPLLSGSHRLPKTLSSSYALYTVTAVFRSLSCS